MTFKNRGLMPEKEMRAEDWVLGATPEDALAGQKPVVFPNGHGWQKFAPTNDYQRVSNGDLNICVTESIVNGYEYYAEYLRTINPEIDAWLKEHGYIDENDNVKFNNRIVALGSGTDPNKGNTVTNVVDFIHEYGLAPQSAAPWDNSWTKERFYYPLTKEQLEAGKPLLEVMTPCHEWIAKKDVLFSQTHYPAQLVEAFKYGPVRVSVDGNYEIDDSGYVCSINSREGKLYYWNHSLLAQEYDNLKFFSAHDHYENQFLKFNWNYPFGNGKLLYFIPKKKVMFRLIKRPGQPNVYLHCVASGDIYGVADGDEVKGGDLLKSFSGTYGNAGIITITNEEFIQYNYVGDISARKFK